MLIECDDVFYHIIFVVRVIRNSACRFQDYLLFFLLLYRLSQLIVFI